MESPPDTLTGHSKAFFYLVSIVLTENEPLQAVLFEVDHQFLLIKELLQSFKEVLVLNSKLQFWTLSTKMLAPN